MSDLTISSNGHYIKKGGSPFLWINETAWYLVQRTSRSDVRYLLDRLAGIVNPTLGCTNVITTSIIMRLTSSEEQNPTNANGHRAFNGGTVPDFTSPKVVAGGTPDAPNDYWDHLDFIVREAKNRGMYVMLLPQWAAAYVRGRVGTTPIKVAAARSYAEFLGNRYKNATNVIWMLGGDGNDPTREGDRALYEAQAEGILKGVSGCTTCPAHDKASPLWNQVTMLYHGDRASRSSQYWDINEKWMNVDGVYAGKFPVLNTAYNLPNPRPIVEIENCGGYWVSTEDQLNKARSNMYAHYLAGGRGPELMNQYVWDFTGDWRPRLSIPERVYLTIYRDIIKSVAWYNLIPDQSIIKSANSFPSADYMKTVISSRSSDKNVIMAYFSAFSTGSAKIDLSSITSHEFAKGTWTNPKTGATQDARTNATSSSPTYTMPTTWADAVLTLEGLGGGTDVIPQTRWTLKFADSEELKSAYRPATHAFDGNANTFWHTEWLANDPGATHPHEIQIDLGRIYNIDGFRYLPRQDSPNGRIKDYQFYVSMDGYDWTLSASGSFNADETEKEVTFSTKTGRYIRLVALNEINRKAWTTVAELNVMGSESTMQPPASHDVNIVIPAGAELRIDGTLVDGATVIRMLEVLKGFIK